MNANDHIGDDILVVDDSQEILLLLTTILQRAGYSVRPFSNPKEALASAQAQQPELCLLDVNMPVLNGFELCRVLKQDPRTLSVPVLFISATENVDDQLKGFEVGGVDFITKPFNSRIVLARIGTHLQLARTQAELQKYIASQDFARVGLEEQASEMVSLAESLHLEKQRVEESKRIIEHQALHDPLTDLGNRALLNKVLPDMMERARDQGAKIGMAYIDLDNFKPVNDRLGHDAGDRLLCDVADGLREAIRSRDVALRLGGDEFSVLTWLEPGEGWDALERMANRILEAVSIPVEGPDFVIQTGGSIGTAIWPDNGADMDAILSAADNAMYVAKRAGKGRIARPPD
ncbi:MAG: diguanylate cyclase [Alphaproteobacteria bacterium]|nr:diguanylate cyclase [Alphaproteobacteria bacterium]